MNKYRSETAIAATIKNGHFKLTAILLETIPMLDCCIFHVHWMLILVNKTIATPIFNTSSDARPVQNFLNLLTVLLTTRFLYYVASTSMPVVVNHSQFHFLLVFKAPHKHEIPRHHFKSKKGNISRLYMAWNFKFNYKTYVFLFYDEAGNSDFQFVRYNS